MLMKITPWSISMHMILRTINLVHDLTLSFPPLTLLLSLQVVMSSPSVSTGSNVTVSLYTQHDPYTSATLKEFDPSLGRHDDFLLLGPYIYAQKTDSKGVRSLYISYQRGKFNQARIPSTQGHQVSLDFKYSKNI